MIRLRGISLLFVLAGVAVGLSPAGEAVAQGNGGEAVGALAVLYDQTDNPHASQSASSQNFEAALDQYDAQGADDFVVPANEAWTVNTVEVLGVYQGSGSQIVSTVNIAVYADSGSGLPGTQVYSATLAPSGGVTTGNFVITLSSPPTLASGKHWVSVQANLDFNPGDRQWFWRERTVQSNNPAAWRNPGGANSGNCLTWGVLDGTCLESSAHSPDLLFKLSGSTVTLNYHIYLPLVVKGP